MLYFEYRKAGGLRKRVSKVSSPIFLLLRQGNNVRLLISLLPWFGSISGRFDFWLNPPFLYFCEAKWVDIFAEIISL